MFQYAVARLAAERLGCEHAIISPYLSRRRVIRYVANLFGSPMRRCGSVFAEVGYSFPAVTQGLAGVALQIGGKRMRRPAFRTRFAPRHAVSETGEKIEIFDDDFFRIENGTLLNGYFQSERYFSGREARVRSWFGPSEADRKTAEAIVTREWRRPCEEMVAIHVRRTDYLTQTGPFRHPKLGWALPDKYYRDALASVPSNIRLAVFSDDPSYAFEMFRPFDAWVSHGHSASGDLLLMSLCRYMIIGNSTLSWWGAWLNGRTDKVVLAPKYHIGWWRKCWFPGDISVRGWNYLDVVEG